MSSNKREVLQEIAIEHRSKELRNLDSDSAQLPTEHLVLAKSRRYFSVFVISRKLRLANGQPYHWHVLSMTS